jgi:glycosyltransferase involved in cell wall biosynthesis
MRIVFFTHYFHPEGNAPASRTYEHCKRWAKAGNEITVITCAPNVPDGVVYEGYRNRIWPQRETVDGVEVIRVWTYVAANAGNVRRILNYLSYMMSSVLCFLFFCRRPNLVIATSPQFFCGWAGAIASWVKWCPLVLEVRDIWPESIVTVGALKRTSLSIRILEVLEKWLYRSARHIVTVGDGYRDNVLSKVNIPDRVSVVTNGVDPSVFQPREPSLEFRRRFGLVDRFVCAYVGTIGMAHGLSVVVRAAKILKELNCHDVVFCLVGDGANRKRIESEVADAEVADLIKFTGRLSKSDIPMVLASSDALLIHLKKTELFESVIPSKIFESMAMERPLIMGVEGESAEIVRQSGSGMFMESENAQQLVDALLKLKNDESMRRRLGANGRVFVKEHYTRDSLAKKFLDKIESLAPVDRARS